VKLHLGCGNVRIPGFIGVDSRDLPAVDQVGPVDKLPMSDNSVELIYACHVLEHFGRNDTSRVLKEWHRVLKPGGTLRLAVPDFEAVVKVYAETKNLGLLLGHLVGRQDYPENTHYMVFDFTLLFDILNRVGFRDIRRYHWRETIHKDYDDYSQGYYPHMNKDYGRLMSLNIECEK